MSACIDNPEEEASKESDRTDRYNRDKRGSFSRGWYYQPGHKASPSVEFRALVPGPSPTGTKGLGWNVCLPVVYNNQ